MHPEWRGCLLPAAGSITIGDMKIAACLVLASVPLGAITLADGGKSAYTICLGPEASPPEERGAAELQRFLEEMSGARLPVSRACRGTAGPFVFVGDSPALRTALPAFDARGFGPEEFMLKTVGPHIAIAGGRQRGTMYGVYTFLERLGCRWFTAEVSRIPRRDTVAAPPLDERAKPAFEYREPFFTEAFDRDWSARNRMNGNSAHLDASTGGKVEYFPFVHSFYSLVPPEKYFKTHPEYFSLIDGRRRVERGQLCLTNPGVLRLGVEQVRAWIRAHPGAGILSVSQNDWEGWCECDRCRRVEEEEGGQHSGPILRFVNALAAEIEKTNPDKLIDTLAYWYSENPPAKVRPKPNVRVRLCPIGVCVSHAYEQCPRSAYFLKNLKAWGAITNQLYIWHYNTNFAHYLAPFPDFDELAADIPLYHRNGVVGLFLEGAYPPGGGGENAELRSYLMARLLWDPRADVRRETEEFLDAVYGRAAKPLGRYLDLLQREVRLPPDGAGQHLWIFNLPRFSRPFLAEAERLFEEALAAAESPAVRRRVEKARLPIEYVNLIEAREYIAGDTTYAPRDLAGWQARLRQFTARLRSFGITSMREGRTLGQDEQAAAEMRAYRLAWMENDAWRVAVAPESGGRILRMIDKRSGADVLRVPQPGEGGYPNLGGQVVQAYPDFPLRAWDIAWQEVSAGPRETVLAGTCPNGVKLTRRIHLESDWVRTEVTAENGAAAPVEVALQARADFEPGEIEGARLRFRTAEGAAVDRPFLVPDEPPTGSETRKATDVPDGSWTLARSGMAAVENRFATELVERAGLNWTAKGGPRVTLSVWSKKKTLAPGERLRLTADYSAVTAPSGSAPR